MRNARRSDERLVRRVEENQPPARIRPVDPRLKLRLRGNRTRRVVRIAEVDDIRLKSVRRRHEGVRRRAGEKRDVVPPRHHVRIDVDGIDGIAHGNLRIRREQFLDVAAVALRAVRNENLVRRDVHAALAEVELGDLLAQEGVALLGSVAVEVRARRLVIDGLVHRRDDGRGERLGDVPDSEADDFRLRVLRLVRRHAVGDFGEEIGRLDFRVVWVNLQHGDAFPCRWSVPDDCRAG